MSYSLNRKCWRCTKSDKCVDSAVLDGAINAIHTIGSERGHLGYGVVDLQCNAFEDKGNPAPPAQ